MILQQVEFAKAGRELAWLNPETHRTAAVQNESLLWFFCS
ncbi:hypothetical protein LBWT_X0830 (plasmid) [Leptolyngbya boryana IAM M-101]|nr:hypothetical protein LBWT_X0830 [Leptolyngbya boryana IAM M-101]BAS66359.1 hypothetical protein LBDG_X0830 [Leptolyngbya boryana dg5]